MTKKEFDGLFDPFMTFYRWSISAEHMEAYFQGVETHSKEELETALEWWKRNRLRFPTPAELEQAVAEQFTFNLEEKSEWEKAEEKRTAEDFFEGNIPTKSKVSQICLQLVSDLWAEKITPEQARQKLRELEKDLSLRESPPPKIPLFDILPLKSSEEYKTIVKVVRAKKAYFNGNKGALKGIKKSEREMTTEIMDRCRKEGYYFLGLKGNEMIFGEVMHEGQARSS